MPSCVEIIEGAGMDHIVSRGGDLDVDLESGAVKIEEDGNRNSGSNGKCMTKLLSRSWSGRVGLGEPMRGREGSISYNKGFNSNDNLFENANKLVREMAILVDKHMEKETRKKNLKVPSKPPRPPRHKPLDDADAKFARQFSELAALKRKRVEQMKLFRKKRAEKASSLRTNLVALIITMVFFFVIFVQGIYLRNRV